MQAYHAFGRVSHSPDEEVRPVEEATPLVTPLGQEAVSASFERGKKRTGWYAWIPGGSLEGRRIQACQAYQAYQVVSLRTPGRGC